MTKMKKLLALLASLTAVATLGLATACGDKGDSSTPDASTPGDSTPVEQAYKFTVKKPDGTPAAGIWLNICDDSCSPVQADANGVATFEFDDANTVYHVEVLCNGDYASYIADDFYTVAGQTEYTVTLQNAGTGTESDPYVIKAGKTYTASKDAQDYVYFTITSDVSGTYTFNLPDTNEGAPIVEISGVDEAVDGVTFDAIAGAKVVIGIVNKGWNDSFTEELYYDTTFSVDFEAGEVTPNGSQLAPFTAENGQSYTVGSWEGVWYTFTAPSAGQYKLTLDDWDTQNGDFSFFTPAYDTLYKGYATDIAEGETVLFRAYSSLDNESSWTFSFGASLENDENHEVPPVVGEYELPLEITAAGDYEITVAAGETYYVHLAFLGQFVVPEGLTAGAWISYPMTQYTAGDTVAHTEYHPMTDAYLDVEIYNNGTEAITATLTAVDYIPPTPIAEGKITVTTTDTYTMYNHDSYTFTATVAGEYAFAIPAGLGIMSENAYMPEVDYYENMSGATVKVLLAAGAEYKFWFSAMEKADWEITYQVFEAEVEEGGEETLNVLTLGNNTVVLSADNYSDGVDYTFTPDVAGLYTFASGDVMFQVLHPMGLQMGNHMMPQMTLEAGITYTVKIASFAAGMYSLTITAPGASEGGETEPDGTVDAPYVIESVPCELAVNYSGTGQVWYTYTATASGTCTFTFQISDTWLCVDDSDSTVWSGSDGHSTTTYTIEMVEGETYMIGIGTWSEDGTAQTINVTLSLS